MRNRRLSIDAGLYRGKEYSIVGVMKDEKHPPQDFAVILYHRDPGRGENIEVAKVDTAHGYTHFHKYYREREPVESVNWSFWESMERFRQSWRKWAENYEKK